MDKDNKNNQTSGRDQSHTQSGNYWNLFFMESAFQVVTWVLIAFAIGGIWYYAGKNDMRGAFWSGVALVIFIILMLGLIADRHFFQGKNTSTEKERPHISIAAIGLSRYIFQPGMFKVNWEIRNSLGGPEISIVDANMTTFFECKGNSLPETPHYIQPERSKLNGVRIAPGDSFLVTYSYEGEPLSEGTVKLIQ
ncbi:MAG TPA: hypothetical protein VGY75_09200, partial [Candidatus Udaeobacter sp.]|nr:hypothetical protein [Candidatus Udaeobacter sp.]